MWTAPVVENLVCSAPISAKASQKEDSLPPTTGSDWAEIGARESVR